MSNRSPAAQRRQDPALEDGLRGTISVQPVRYAPGVRGTWLCWLFGCVSDYPTVRLVVEGLLILHCRRCGRPL